MRKNGVMKWRFIDAKKHQAAVKSLPLGPETPYEAGEVRGEPWMKRVLNSISNPKQKTDERWESILKENQEAEKQLSEVQKAIEERRRSGKPFDI